MPIGDAIDTVLEPQQGEDAYPACRRRVALCFGNERRGASAALRDASDARFFLPMLGFVQSINVSVAVALATAAFLNRTPDFAVRAAAAHEAMQRTAAFPPSAAERRTLLLPQQVGRAAAAAKSLREKLDGQDSTEEATTASFTKSEAVHAELPALEAPDLRGFTAAVIDPTSYRDEGVRARRASELRCEGLSAERCEEVMAGWLLSEVSGASELLSRAGVRPRDL